MHEMSLCEGIVEIAEEQAKIRHYTRVVSIRLEIGRLSCAEPEALRFAFDAVARGTIAEEAKLMIEEVPGIAWCHNCKAEVEIGACYDACPVCESYPLEIRSGDAMRIRDMEVA